MVHSEKMLIECWTKLCIMHSLSILHYLFQSQKGSMSDKVNSHYFATIVITLLGKISNVNLRTSSHLSW